MARGKAINVKIATPKVIKALEARLAQLEADYTKQDENEAKYRIAQEKWQKEVGKWAVGQITKAQNLRTNYRSWNKTLNVDFDLICNENEFPAEPQREYEVLLQHSYTEMKEEIENALRILKMCDDELISTATYGGITKYL